MPYHDDIQKDPLEKVKVAFPNGDLEGHRKAHEKMIQDIEDRKRFYRDLGKDSLRYIVQGIVVIAGLVLLQVAQMNLSRSAPKPVDTPRAAPPVPASFNTAASAPAAAASMVAPTTRGAK